MVVNGRRAALSGGAWYIRSRSGVWFWRMVVVVACALAAWRLHDARLNRRLARPLAFLTGGRAASWATEWSLPSRQLYECPPETITQRGGVAALRPAGVVSANGL